MGKLAMRSYQAEDDYWRIRDFLREIFLLNDRRMFCWPVARLDYWRWQGIFNLGDGSLETGVLLWETPDHQIAAVVNQEEYGQVYLQIHPNFKTIELEEEMTCVAEEHLRAPSRRGGLVMWIWCDSGDTLRQEVLKRHGYIHLQEYDEHQWRRSLELPIPDYPVRMDYVVRSLGDEFELPSRSWASWRAFHSDQPDENYGGDGSWYRNIQSAPLYRRDLDLVAIDPDGLVAAFATAWYEDTTRTGCFEPVGTVPEHRRLGLASALLYEAMRRLLKMGASQVMTTGGTPHANGLYQAVLGPIYDLYQPWEKRWA